MAISSGAAMLGGAVLGSGLLGGNKSGTSTTTQNSEPWVGVRPHLTQLFERANALSWNPYDYRANQSPFTRQAQQLTAQRALDPNSLIGRSQGVLADTLSGKYMDFANNPALQDALGQAKSQMVGMYGGAAGQNINNTGFQEAMARGLGGVAAQTYNQERQNQLNATQLAPALDFANLQALAGVGSQQEALNKQQYNSPWENLANYQSMLAGNFGGTTTTQQPYYTNPFAGMLGGALAGGQIYKMF